MNMLFWLLEPPGLNRTHVNKEDVYVNYNSSLAGQNQCFIGTLDEVLKLDPDTLKKLIRGKIDHSDKQLLNLVKDNTHTFFDTKDELEQPQEDKDKKSDLGSHNKTRTLLEADETLTYRNIDLRKFREAMAKYYSFDEIYLLAVDLGLDMTNRNVAGEGDNPRVVAQGFIDACLHEGVLDELISQVLDKHPALADQLKH